MPDPVIRLDRSKTFSTNHGDMLPEDPHYRVRFWQGGTLVYQGKKHSVLLPFDAEGSLVPDDGKTQPWKSKDADNKEVTYHPLYDVFKREYLKARLARAAQAAAAPRNEPHLEDEGEGDDETASAPSHEDVDLTAWLRGQAEYAPYLIRAAVRERTGHPQGRISDIVVELVYEEKLIPEEEVCPALKVHLDTYNKLRSQAA